MKDDSNIIHKAVRKPFSGSVSLCGDNGMNMTIEGVVRRIYGGAKRSMDETKVNCIECKQKLKGKKHESI